MSVFIDMSPREADATAKIALLRSDGAKVAGTSLDVCETYVCITAANLTIYVGREEFDSLIDWYNQKQCDLEIPKKTPLPIQPYKTRKADAPAASA